MDVRYEDDDLDVGDGSVVAVGTFDGVHLGHRAVLAETCTLARDAHATSVVVILDRHPAADARPDREPPLLTDLQQRLELLGASGVDLCYVLRSDEVRSLPEPGDFVREVLVDRLSARVLVVGDGIDLGRRPRDDATVPAGPGSADRVQVVELPLVGRIDGRGPVSASAIREALAGGDVTGAAGMLGRLHEVRGVVEHGDHRGRTIGFPTANVAVPGEVALPADGIYAGWYERPSGDVHVAAINLGTRPTFYDQDGPRLLEAYLLDFAGDLYGEQARVRFHTRLRGEVKFSSVDALVERMHLDVADARRLLSG